MSKQTLADSMFLLRFCPSKLSASSDSKGMIQEAWTVIDRQHEQYHMPERAIPINVYRVQAFAIASELNQAWIRFTTNPT